MIQTRDQVPTRSSKTDSLSTLKRQVEHIRDFELILVIELYPARVVTRLEVMELLNTCCDIVMTVPLSSDE